MPSETAKLNDTALVRLVLAGENECFAELMRRHTKAVRARVESIVRNPSDVDDIVQETFIKAWRGLSSFRVEAAVRTWLYTIATNEALMYWRRERRRRSYESSNEFDTLPALNEPADQAMIRREESEAIRRAVVRLPLKYRAAVVLRDLEEISLKTAAEQLKSTIPATKTRVFRGRLKLAAALRHSPAQSVVHAA